MTGWLSLSAATYFDEDMEEVRWIAFLMQCMVNAVFHCYSFIKFYLLVVMILIRKATLFQAQNVY
jgi:hypothetical protein